jgi:subtilisin family serine protease
VVLLEFRRGVSRARERAIERSVEGWGVRSLAPRQSADAAEVPLRMDVPDGRVRGAVASLRRNAAVRNAEPDWLVEVTATPNDPEFSLQWSDSNIGQVVPVQNVNEEFEGKPMPGIAGDDANVLKAWEVTTGSPAIVVGEVDAGVDYNQPDLRGNIWSNPGHVLGCEPLSHGYNVLTEACEPMDTEAKPSGFPRTTYGGHGTHVAGIIGAVGNNGSGVAGINWRTTILPVKWLSSAAEPGEVANLIAGIEKLRQARDEGVNIRVVNDSAVSASHVPDALLMQAVEKLAARDILFVTAAGNTHENDDKPSETRYPCAYGLPNELCVTASNDEDALAKFANYGAEKVNLAAPGVGIYSTLHNGPAGEEHYGYLSGGSMAAAQVSGAAALILSSVPSMTATQLKADILEHVTKVPALTGMVSSGGILNVCDAIPLCLNPPSPPSTATTSTTPAPPPPPPVPELQVPAVTVAHATVTARRHGTIRLALRCALTAPSCTGQIALRLRGVHKRVHGHIVHGTTTVTVATASFSILRGATRVLTLHLAARARAQLAGHHTLSLHATIAARGTNGSVHTTVITVTVRPPKHR